MPFDAPAHMEAQAHRRERLQDAIDRYGGEDALGQALGFKNGAFVRQMRAGHRPITEKTVLKIEALRGMAGWFDEPGETLISVTAAEKALLLAWRAQMKHSAASASGFNPKVVANDGERAPDRTRIPGTADHDAEVVASRRSRRERNQN